MCSRQSREIPSARQNVGSGLPRAAYITYCLHRPHVMGIVYIAYVVHARGRGLLL